MINNDNYLPLLEVLENEQTLMITCDKDKLSFFLRIFDPEDWDGVYDHDDFTVPVDLKVEPHHKDSKPIVYMQINHIDFNGSDVLFDIRFNINGIWIFFNLQGAKVFNEKLKEFKNNGSKQIFIETCSNKLYDYQKYGLFISKIRIELIE